MGWVGGWRNCKQTSVKVEVQTEHDNKKYIVQFPSRKGIDCVFPYFVGINPLFPRLMGISA